MPKGRYNPQLVSVNPRGEGKITRDEEKKEKEGKKSLKDHILAHLLKVHARILPQKEKILQREKGRTSQRGG